jgi:hypothetical protein
VGWGGGAGGGVRGGGFGLGDEVLQGAGRLVEARPIALWPPPAPHPNLPDHPLPISPPALMKSHPEAMSSALQQHNAIIRKAKWENCGHTAEQVGGGGRAGGGELLAWAGVARAARPSGRTAATPLRRAGGRALAGFSALLPGGVREWPARRAAARPARPGPLASQPQPPPPRPPAQHPGGRRLPPRLPRGLPRGLLLPAGGARGVLEPCSSGRRGCTVLLRPLPRSSQGRGVHGSRAAARRLHARMRSPPSVAPRSAPSPPPPHTNRRSRHSCVRIGRAS